MLTIKWDRMTNFTGRNGYFVCSGIEVMPLESDKKVMLTPLTGRGDCARCNVTIPVESLPELITALQACLPGAAPSVPVPSYEAKRLAVDGLGKNDLIARGWEGDTIALDALELLSDESHDGDCSYRCKGECDCSKATIYAILEAHGRAVA